MPDYPDYTQLFRLVGSDITLNINIESSGITLPVAINASTVALDVNITSSVQLNVNIASSDITLNVNITASTVTLNISFTGQVDAVYIASQWWSKQAQEQYLYGTASSQASGSAADVVTYTVPTGKTLFLTAFGAYVAVNDANCIAYLNNWTDGIVFAATGGQGGCGMSFDTPARITAGKTLKLWVAHYAGTPQFLRGFCNGYLI